MKQPKTKGILPLSFVDDKLKQPLKDADDFLHRIRMHVNEQISELKKATDQHQLPSIRPLAESIKNGMNLQDFNLADEALDKIQDKAGKLQDDEELEMLIEKVATIWKDYCNQS